MNNRFLRRSEFFVSTKAELLTKKVNAWFDEMEERYGVNFSVETYPQPVMSYTTINNKGAYMIGCCVDYILFIDKEEETK